MNNKIRKQNIEKLLFFDIETTRRNKELDLNSKEYDLYAWKLRDKETSKLPPSDEVLEHYKLNGALDPVFNKIVCISVGFVSGKTLYVKSFTGEQKDIIEQFYILLNSTGLIPSGFNVINFDAPVTRLKALESGVDLNLIGECYNDVGQKPWDLESAFVDLMPLTKGTYYYNLSLDAMCFLAGVETPKDDISGADVSRVYWEEENGISRISEYCKKDVIAVAKLFCALQGNKDFIEEVIDRTENKGEVFVEEAPLLQRIYKAEFIDETTKNSIKEKLSKKKLTKKDKEYLEDILTSLYVSNEMFKSDKPEVKERKIKEIKELING